MPWKFLVFLVFLAIVILFAGINVTNSADINLGFYHFEDVPVFVGLGSAYMLGALSILPFALGKAFSKRRKLSTKYKEKQRVTEQKNADSKAKMADRAEERQIAAGPPEGTPQQVDPPKGLFGRKKKRKTR